MRSPLYCAILIILCYPYVASSLTPPMLLPPQAKIDNELVASTCTGAMQILLPLMNLGPGATSDPSAASEYLKELHARSRNLPPVAFVATGATDSIISEGL